MPAILEGGAALRLSRVIQAPRDRVFAAWTTPADIMKWFGPATCQTLSAQVDLQPGGEYHFHVRTETFGELDLRGVYREVRAPAELVYTWRWSGHPALEFGETLVTVEFAERNGFTEVQITHDRLPDPKLREDHFEGWNGCLDKLAKQMTEPGREPVPNRIVWFDMPVRDLDRAIRFYSSVLEANVQKQQYPGMTFAVLPHPENGVGGCLIPVSEGDEAKPSPHGPLLYFSCQGRLDQAIAAVEPNAGKVLKPKHSMGPYGFRAVVSDSEGNRIALHSM